VKPGDIVIVPARVVHGWLGIAEQVDYLSFRPSPNIPTARLGASDDQETGKRERRSRPLRNVTSPAA
jgi:hypothetical protein